MLKQRGPPSCLIYSVRSRGTKRSEVLRRTVHTILVNAMMRLQPGLPILSSLHVKTSSLGSLIRRVHGPETKLSGPQSVSAAFPGGG